MTKKAASQDTLGDLHSTVTKMLKERLLTGDYSPADMANAIRFLKDNGIEAVPTAGSELDKLMQSLPEFGTPDHELPH